MKILFVTPQVGRKGGKEYVRTWQMEPLMIATLAALTPDDVDITYVDERIGEEVNYDEPFDLVAITVETYTAKRAYEISTTFCRRGIQTILGGYHVTLIPEEASHYSTSICIGYAEGVWADVLKDSKLHKLKPVYVAPFMVAHPFVTPNREIFGSRDYFKVSCVETGRGCPSSCNFCSIAAATKSKYRTREIGSLVTEIATLKNKNVFFVEDNFVGNMRHAKEFLREIASLKVRWFGQGTLSMAHDEELLGLMKESGCIGVLIGFESFYLETLNLMKKQVNYKLGNYQELVKRLHTHGISIYGTFVFGYDFDTPAIIAETTNRAIDMGLCMGAFNHLVPFPGTPLYHQFVHEGRMKNEKWWLDPAYKFGEVTFRPQSMTAEELHAGCIKSRQAFYSVGSIASRAMTNMVGNLGSVKSATLFAVANYLLRKEIGEKDGLPLGNDPNYPEALQKKGGSSYEFWT